MILTSDKTTTTTSRTPVRAAEIVREYGPFAGASTIHGISHDGRSVAVLLPPFEGDQASLLALLADGAAWSTSALALALDASQRTVQRALVELEAAGRVRSIGRTRAQRWLAPSLAGFTTILLLPASLPLT